jgi:DNA-directed RNA polymerase specialized sigma24 family protein
MKRVRLKALQHELAGLYPSLVRPLSPAPPPGDPEDQTGRWVERRQALEARIARLKERIELIEAALATLSAEERELARLKYEEGLSPSRICREVGLSRASYFRLRRAVVEKVAQALGYLPEAAEEPSEAALRLS